MDLAFIATKFVLLAGCLKVGNAFAPRENPYRRRGRGEGTSTHMQANECE